MTHLSREALVDLAEGGTAGRDHLDACAACRARVDSMRQMMGVLQNDRVPEPSPLFWEHLADRISRAVVEQATPTPDWRVLWRWSWGLTAVAGIIIAALVMRSIRIPESPAVADRSAAASVSQAAREIVGAANDVSWAVAGSDDLWEIVESAAAGLDVEAAVDAGILVREGSLDRELLMLSDQERQDLARAIQAELDRARL